MSTCLCRLPAYSERSVFSCVCVCVIVCALSLQLFVVVVNEYDLQFPSVVRIVTSSLSFLNLSMFSVVTLGCRVSFLDQFDRLLIVTLIPICVTALLGLFHTLLRVRVWFDESTRVRWQHNLFTGVLIVMFLVLPSV